MPQNQPVLSATSGELRPRGGQTLPPTLTHDSLSQGTVAQSRASLTWGGSGQASGAYPLPTFPDFPQAGPNHHPTAPGQAGTPSPPRPLLLGSPTRPGSSLGSTRLPLTSARPRLFEYCRHTAPRSPLLLCPQARPSPPHGPSSLPAQEDRAGAHLPSLASCAGLSSVMTCGRNGRRCRRPSASFMSPLQRTSAAAAHLPRPLHTPPRSRPLAPPPRTPDHARALPSGRSRSPPQRAGGGGPAVSSGVAGRAVRIDSYPTATGISASSSAASWAVWGSRGQGWVLQLFPSRARPWHGEPERQGPEDGARKPQGREGGKEGGTG